jgi:hypothetical protein
MILKARANKHHLIRSQRRFVDNLGSKTFADPLTPAEKSRLQRITIKLAQK